MVWNEVLKREIPKGWQVLSLETLGSFKNGINYSKDEVGNFDYRIVNVRNISSSSLFIDTEDLDEICLKSESADNYLVDKNDILIARSGTPGATRILQNEVKSVIYCGFIICYSVKDQTLKPLLTYQLKDLERITKVHSNGSILSNISQDVLKKLQAVVPSIGVLQNFNSHIFSIWHKLEKTLVETSNLVKQRDELLPLLMNGQVSLNSDLSYSVYIIYGLRLSVFMKESIITAVVTAMQRDLDCRQMARLKAVLIKELQDVEVSECKGTEQQRKDGNNDLLDAFISAKKIEGCSDKTLSYYRSTIERFFLVVNVAVCHVTTSDIRQYLSQYQEKNHSSKVTIDNMRRIFSSFFAWLEDEDYIAKSPVRRIHKVKTDTLVKEVLTDEQLEQLRDNCTNRRDLAIIDVLASTGIRVGELVILNRADIDFHERQCVVFGKGNKERMVYFNARTKLHLQQYLAERTDDNPALFVSLSSPHNRLTISGVETCIRKMGKRLDIPKVHPHKFRRTLATMAIDKGMPIEQVQRLLGHVRIDTTLHYAIVNQNNVKMAHKKYLG